MARAFLQVGYRAYIAPIEDYADTAAALVFATSFFYALLAEDRDYAPKTYTEREAFSAAAQLDADFRYGTAAFRYYCAEEL